MKPITYLALLILVVIGVAGGNLLSNWLQPRIGAPAVQAIATEASQDRSQQGSQRTSEAQDAAENPPQQESKGRAATEVGQDLARRCMEWQKADEQYHTVTTQLESKRSCDRYTEFLNTGH
jgi:hypothetical protein